MRIIHEKNKIDKFLITICLGLYLTKTQMAYIVGFIIKCSEMNFNGKINNMSLLSVTSKHRTSIGRFFSDSKWNEDKILKVLKQSNLNEICELSVKTGNPISIIIDDTISIKTKPSSKAEKTIDGCKYHFSHTDKKHVYGYQIVIATLNCGNYTLPYFMCLYNKETESKINMARAIITELSGYSNVSYVLADSWYSSESVIKDTIKAGYTYIGALKTNRVIYPNNIKKGIQICSYIEGLKKKSFNLVTVNGKKYHAYRYHGKINGFEEVVVIITYPIGSFGNNNSIKAFISTDPSMSTSEILHKYSTRWSIEPFIRSCKMYLGLDGCQMRSLKAIKRFLILVMIAYSYFAQKNKKYSFSENIRNAQNNLKMDIIMHIYNLGVANTPIEVVYKMANA